MKNTLIAGLALFTALPAHALVGGAVDPNTPTSPFAGVGAVSVGGGAFSGALINNQYVLTAAHVVGGQVNTPGKVSFTLNLGGEPRVFSAESIKVFPGYTGTKPGSDGVWHDDLALIKLALPVGGVVSYGLYGGPLGGQTLTLAGYGAGGDGKNGAFIAANPNVKRVGQNRVDVLLKDDDMGGTQNEIYIFDFDGPNASSNVYGNSANSSNLTLGANIEAQFAGGDSGGPVFVNDNGVMKIAGIATFNGSTTGLPGSNVVFGAIGGGTIIAPYQTWLQENSVPVPEADSYLMFIAGLGLVGFMSYRRKVYTVRLQ